MESDVCDPGVDQMICLPNQVWQYSVLLNANSPRRTPLTPHSSCSALSQGVHLALSAFVIVTSVPADEVGEVMDCHEEVSLTLFEEYKCRRKPQSDS